MIALTSCLLIVTLSLWNSNGQQQPQEGESCTGCQLPACACGLCPDGANMFGCCGGCIYQKSSFSTDLTCAAEPTYSCPQTTTTTTVAPKEGDYCTGCQLPLCPCGLCPDGINSFGCCGGCIYQKVSSSSELICAAEPSYSCPATTTNQPDTAATTTTTTIAPKEGDVCTGCQLPLCPCGLCPDGVNNFGCCGGCIYQKSSFSTDLICAAEPSYSCPPTSTIIPDSTTTIAPNEGDSCSGCQLPSCPCGLCPDGVHNFGCCGGCIYQKSSFSTDLICAAEPSYSCPPTSTTMPDSTTTTTTTQQDTTTTSNSDTTITSQSDTTETSKAADSTTTVAPNEGDACSGCQLPACPCGLCPDGVNNFGCCGGCIYQKSSFSSELICAAEPTYSCPPTSTTSETATTTTESPVYSGRANIYGTMIGIGFVMIILLWI